MVGGNVERARVPWMHVCGGSACLGLVLIALQITLGIYTIWTNKAADVATSHVAVGAASLVWGVLTTTG